MFWKISGEAIAWLPPSWLWAWRYMEAKIDGSIGEKFLWQKQHLENSLQHYFKNRELGTLLLYM